MRESKPQNPCVEQTIAIIYQAFAGATREGGVSWAESSVIDGFGTLEERAQARLHPMESGWQDLVGDQTWDADTTFGGWLYLDAIGFRYYVAPAMVRGLRSENIRELRFNFQRPEAPYLSDWEQNWSLLSEDQVQAVCEFLRCMMVVTADDVTEWSPDKNDYAEAYRSHWVKLDDNPI